MSIPRISSYELPEHDALPVSRVSWTPSADRSVLLIHDMQDYFVNFYDNSMQPMASVIANILALRRRCDELSVPTVYTAQPSVQSREDRGLLQTWWGDGVTAAPELASVIQALEPRPQDQVLTKWRYSAFARTPFESVLRDFGRDQVLICGVYAHIGCLATATDAFMRDFQPVLVGDAIADFSRTDHDMAMQIASSSCALVMSTRKLIETLAPNRPSGVASMDDIRAQVAELLELGFDDVPPEANLMNLGLDSIRLMWLLERWRSDGFSIVFADFAEDPTILSWWALLSNDAQRRTGTGTTVIVAT